MARRIEVDIIGDASSLQRAFRETATGAQRFEAKITGSFHNIARSAVVAAGAFVGFSAAGQAFRTVINAAVDAQRSTRQLTAQMKASGESFQANRQAIEQAGLAMGKFGFTVEDSQKALTVLDRGTKNISQSIRLQGLAADIARAKNLDLADAANVLAKVFGGQETALRRAVPGLSKHAHGLELIAQASRRLAGQAAAGTTAEERFHAILHDTEVIIGSALLPTVNRFLGRLSEWLDKMNQSGRLQRDVNQALQTATGIINALKGPVEAVAGAFKTLGSAVGGTKNEVELLAAAFAAWRVTGWLTALGALTGGIRGVGTSARTSAGQVAGLRAVLGRLGAMGVIGVTIAVSYEVAKGGQWLSKALGTLGIPGVGNQNFPSARAAALAAVAQGMSQAQFVKAAGIGGISPQAAAAAYTAAVRAETYTVTRPPARRPAGAAPAHVAGSAAQGWGQPLTQAQQLQLALAAHPASLAVLGQQAAFDRQQIAFLTRLHARGRGPQGQKYVQELTGFYNDLNSTLSTIAGIQKKAAQTARIHIPANISGTAVIPGVAAFGRTETRGFTAGLGAYLRQYGMIGQYQEPLGLQVALSRAGALGLDQSGILRRIRAAARKALDSGRLALAAQQQAWDIITSINQQLAQQAIGGATKYRHIQRAVFTVGASSDAYAGAYRPRTVVINGGLHLHGVQDVGAMESALEARAKRRPHPRRGR